MYLLTAVGFGGTFAVFTFLSPLLTQITGVPKDSVNIALLLFGGATVLGNLAGGNLSDLVGTRKAMIILLCGLIASFALLRVAIHNEIATFVVIAGWGVFAFAIPPVMQAGVLAAAKVAPESLGTASGFNIAAFNLGISSGSFIGGQITRARVARRPLRLNRYGGHRAVDHHRRAPQSANNRVKKIEPGELTMRNTENFAWRSQSPLISIKVARVGCA